MIDRILNTVYGHKVKGKYDEEAQGTDCSLKCSTQNLILSTNRDGYERGQKS